MKKIRAFSFGSASAAKLDVLIKKKECIVLFSAETAAAAAVKILSLMQKQCERIYVHNEFRMFNIIRA